MVRTPGPAWDRKSKAWRKVPLWINNSGVRVGFESLLENKYSFTSSPKYL